MAGINVTGMAANLASLNLNGCTALTTLTLGTMSALTDIERHGNNVFARAILKIRNCHRCV